MQEIHRVLDGRTSQDTTAIAITMLTIEGFIIATSKIAKIKDG